MFTGKLEKLIKVEKDHKLHSVNSFVLFNPIQTALGGVGGLRKSISRLRSIALPWGQKH